MAELPDPDRGALVVMVGPPGSGKSTWVGARFRPHQIVNLDTLRAWVCNDPADQSATPDAVDIQHLVLTFRSGRGLTTVVDNTSVRAGLREELLRHARSARMLTVAVVMDTPLSTCLARNGARTRGGGWVPAAVVHRLHQLMGESVPPVGALPGFAVTRRVGPRGADTTIHDDVYLPHWRAAANRGEPWIR